MIRNGKRRKSIVGAACASYALGRHVIVPQEFVERSFQFLPADRSMLGLMRFFLANNDPDGWIVERFDKHG